MLSTPDMGWTAWSVFVKKGLGWAASEEFGDPTLWKEPEKDVGSQEGVDDSSWCIQQIFSRGLQMGRAAAAD